MSTAQKQLELQYKVRQNAEDYRNQISDLLNWEKEIKDKELKLKSATITNNCNEVPVRSHVDQNQKPAVAAATKLQQNTPAELSKQKLAANVDADANREANDGRASPSEKKDPPVDIYTQRHKEANDIKDTGNQYVKLAKYQLAIEAYTKAIEIFPYDAVFFSNRAFCYLKLELYDECINDCDHAIEVDKTCVKAYYRRMVANESLGNNMDALKDCTTVLAIEPKNSEAKSALKRINERIRKLASASKGPNFSENREDLIDILPIEKPVFKRSKKPMQRISIVDIVGPRQAKVETGSEITISDEDMEKLFNNNSGPFEEVKPKVAKKYTYANASDAALKNRGSSIKTATNTKAVSACGEKETQVKKVQIETKPTPQKVEILKPVVQKSKEDSTLDVKATTSQAETQETKEIESPLPPAPTCAPQFYVHWKELSPKQKYKYLKSIELVNLCRVLGAGFDSDTLTELLEILHDFYLPNKDVTFAATLLEISKNSQVSILSLLMSQHEKTLLLNVLDAFEEFPNIGNSVKPNIQKNFNLI